MPDWQILVAKEQALPIELLTLIRQEAEDWQNQDQRIRACTDRIQAHAQLDERCHRVGEISGVGSLTADAAVATVGNGQVFKNGRQMAAWIGLVPRQSTTGGHVKLGRTTRDGNAYLRTLLVQGARSTHKLAMAADPDQATPEQRWIQGLNQRMVYGKGLVAIANMPVRSGPFWSTRPITIPVPG